MDGGWIKLYRKTRDSIAFSNSNSLALWVRILMSCASRRTVLRDGCVLQPGQCRVSYAELAKWLEVDRRTVSKYIKVFESEGMIHVETMYRKGTTLTVCNWGTYQHTEEAECTTSVQQAYSNGIVSGSQRDHKRTQSKNKRRKEGESGARAQKFVAPTIDEVAAYCAERGNGVDPQRFIDHYEANGWKQGRGKPIKNWKAAVRTWESNGVNQKPAAQNTISTFDQLREACERGEHLH